MSRASWGDVIGNAVQVVPQIDAVIQNSPLTIGLFWAVYGEIIISKNALTNILPFDPNWLACIVIVVVLIVVLMVRHEGMLKSTATVRRSRIEAIVSKTPQRSKKDAERRSS